MDGQLIYEPEHQIENRGYYVAVGNEVTGFKHVKYGISKPVFTTYINSRMR